MSYDPLGHLGGLRRIIEQQERMRRELERQAQPLVDAARRAEEMMRPFQNSLKRDEYVGRQLGASLEVIHKAEDREKSRAAGFDR